MWSHGQNLHICKSVCEFMQWQLHTCRIFSHKYSFFFVDIFLVQTQINNYNCLNLPLGVSNALFSLTNDTNDLCTTYLTEVWSRNDLWTCRARGLALGAAENPFDQSKELIWEGSGSRASSVHLDACPVHWLARREKKTQASSPTVRWSRLSIGAGTWKLWTLKINWIQSGIKHSKSFCYCIPNQTFSFVQAICHEPRSRSDSVCKWSLSSQHPLVVRKCSLLIFFVLFCCFLVISKCAVTLTL